MKWNNRRPALVALLVSLTFACTKAAPKTAAPEPAPAAAATAKVMVPPPAVAVATPPATVDLPKIAFETYKLANGLNVILHVDDKMPAVNVNLWYHVGSKDERAGKTGFAHLFEHMMFQGSKHVNGEYLTLVERAGASLKTGGVNGTTDSDRTNYFETVPTTSLEYALWLESDRMGFLLDRLDQKSLDNQRSVVQNEKRQGDNRPYSALHYIIADYMYPTGHAYAHTVIGSMEDLNGASLADVQEFFKKFYAPNNASLALSGNFDLAQGKELVAKYFGPLAPSEPVTRAKAVVPVLDADRLVVRSERAPQAKLVLVWHAPEFFHKDEAALEFTSEILGGGPTSRLYRRLVRDEKVASRVDVYTDSQEASGLFVVEVLLSATASLDKVRDEVLEEVKRFGDAGPTDLELAQRKTTREFQFVSEIERIGGFGGKADRLNRYFTFLGDADHFQDDLGRYTSLTKTDLTRAAGTWLLGRHHLEIRFVPDSSGRAKEADFDRSKEPSTAGNLPVHLPKIDKRVLANGLEVYVSARPGLPKVEAALLLKHLDLAETPANAGASYLTAATVTEGTTTRTSEAIHSALESLGTELHAEGGKFGSTLALATLKRNLGASLEILADVVINPNFPASEVDLAKKLRLDQIQQEANSPAQLANDLFPRLLFAGGHPVGIADRGTAASVTALTRDALVQNHETLWAPNNAALLLVGDVTTADAEALAKQYFGAWQPREIKAPVVDDAAAPAKMKIYLIDAQGAPQSQIRIFSTAPRRQEPDYVSLQVMNGALGGTFSSRLNLNLREDKGYAYGAYSTFSQTHYYGCWMAGAGVQTQSTAPALVEFKKEIQRLGKGPMPPEELAGLQKNLSRSYLQNFETLGQVIRQVSPLIANGVDLNFLEHYVDELLKETPASVIATAAKHLSFEHSLVLIVGDLAVIEKPVRALGWGDVTVLDKEGKVLR